MNIYQPAQSAVTGILAPVNFASTVQFICSAIQAASRENWQQSSKLCVQYLAPIIKNRQYNFPPLGVNPVAGASARPNEITYSEDRLNPHLPPQAPPDVQAAGSAVVPAIDDGLLPAELPSPGGASQPTDPGLGLQGMMAPPDASPAPPAAPPPGGTP
jgi:phospholipid/cholesterol/gamma-HCH transport system substrate-binding protein